ncbi:hypothetical protein BBJ28_00025448 [Nothophytophthora sp. Chile5]|nr:hypothetical protein BBJ28_00025448 [Nothophytophthora sp. Chile5]
MVPVLERSGTADQAELQFSSFLTQLKAPPSPGSMRPEQWASPTSITTNPMDDSETSQPLPSFTLDQTTGYYVSTGIDASTAQRHPVAAGLSTSTGYFGQHFQPQHQPESQASWCVPPFNSSSAMLPGDFLSQPQHQHVLNPLVLQHGEPLPRTTDDDLAFDAQMLREALQEMPPAPAPSHGQPPTQPRGLQLLFAAPLHPTEMTVAVSQPPLPAFFGNPMGVSTGPADLLLTMSQASSPMAVAVTPIFSSAHTQAQSPLHGVMAMPTNAAGAVGLRSSLPPLDTSAIVTSAPSLAKKKRTTATRICKIEGCTKGIRSRGLCKAHGGGRRCTTPGCTTSDQGGGHCVLHGGGRRCRIEGCVKSAQWRGVCKMHGGARRCRYGQCTKNGQVKQGYCRMHHNLLTSQRQQQLQQVQLPNAEAANPPSDSNRV